MNNSNIPKIRFRGYTDPWEQRKLLSCIEKITDFRGRTPKKLGMDWSESGYLALSALNVKDGYIDFSQDVHYGEQALYDKWMSGNELHKGQVLFTTEAPMGNVAQVPDNKRYILSQRTIAFDVKEDIITENFLATLLRSPAVFNTLTSLSSGGTAKGVSQKSLAGVDIQIPVELREQELLATYFANLDNLITLHQRKYDKFVTIKKAMLEKMFPKKGETVPGIRFKGFTDPWEQRKVSDLFETVESGNRLPKTMIYKGNIPYVVASNENNGIVDYISENQNDFHGKRMKLFTENSITFSIDNPEAIFVQKVPFFTSNIMRVLHNDKYNYYHIVCFSELIKGLTSFYNWSFKFSGPVVMSSDVFVPVKANGNIDLAEIEKIGKTLSELDNLITFHQRKLKKIKNIKQACLEKMFV